MLSETQPVLISLNEVCRLTSLSRTAINYRRAAGTFPGGVPLGGNKRVAFIRAEVLSWIEQRIASRQKEAA